ncbi:MAG: S1 RNA-binding domain-containing protein, partial [Tateyamaria sp.]|nr:S1 RNA-binding domain-containing protein [Tateyamaria sp.]
MPKKMLIDATHAEETRVVVVDGNKVEEFDFESENRRQLAGNIYLAKVTRVEPSLQAAFVDYGGNRHGFLAFSEIHPDYYQIPVADREALLAEERAYAEAQKVRDEEEEKVATKPKSSRRRSSSKSKAVAIETDDATASTEIEGMQTIDLDEEFDKANAESTVDTKGETPVEAPVRAEDNAQEATSEDVVAPSEAEADTVADAGNVSEPDANAVPDG